jgi:hypothetical protein
MFSLSADEYDVFTLRRGEKESKNCEDTGKRGSCGDAAPILLVVNRGRRTLGAVVMVYSFLGRRGELGGLWLSMKGMRSALAGEFGYPGEI